ncbi:amidase [Halomarina halobia]|uniref:Amidase n=1 Tax=Halomarina halobia TaxID=3033386 RepID=A0ABD6ADL8_9EURY|nr:amidase family protein [Halomarina sp. PSR21]
MKRVSERELSGLGEAFDVAVRDEERAELRDQVNSMLADLDAIDNVPVTQGGIDVTDRSWSDPEDDPHNAFSVRCRVSPTGGDDGPLAGERVGVKDIIAVAGVPMECASEVMQGFVPGVDATVVRRMLDSGATITAKTNLDEFAGAPHGVTASDGPTTNPYDGDRLAGGSSSGSAVAVALDEVDIALGTDTGGSIRIPAAFCGLVGYKPTYGLVPLSGIIENTYTQDHVGPLSTSIEETARVLEAMAGVDPADPASLQAAGRSEYRVGGYVDAVEAPPSLDDLELGILEQGTGNGIDDEVTERTRETVDRLRDTGASVRRVSVDHFAYGKAIKNCLSFAEMAAHWRAGGAPYRRGGRVDPGFQVSLARRASAGSGELGTFYKSKLLAGAKLIRDLNGRPYTRAQLARERLRSEFDDALADVDAIVLPTVPSVAPRVEDAFEPEFDYARNTRAANVTRLPAVTLPNGAVDGLPVGLQLVGRAFEDDLLLSIAASIEPHLPQTSPE